MSKVFYYEIYDFGTRSNLIEVNQLLFEIFKIPNYTPKTSTCMFLYGH